MRITSPPIARCRGGFSLLVPLLASLGIRAADSDIIINEIMYHPPAELENLQYVELFNRGHSAVDISNWSFTKGIRYVFPEKTTIGPNAYLVVCRNVADFSRYYGSEIVAVGNFSGKLSHKGDRIELSNGPKQIVDTVKYSDRGDWPVGADGYSPSLERICPTASGQGPENWASSKLPNVRRPGGTPGKKNDSFSAKLPPVITAVAFSPRIPAPGQKVSVSASVADGEGVQSVTLLYHVATPRKESAEQSIPMNRITGVPKNGTYAATIEGQAPGQLVRFRIKAVAGDGTERLRPSVNEPRPTYSYYTPGVTNNASIPFGFIIQTGPSEQRGASFQSGPRGRQPSGTPARGNGAFIYMPPHGGEVQVFDHLRITPRGGGVKVRFLKDQTLHGMTVANIIFEGPPRWVLAEPLAYELYRKAGMPAELTEHIRIWRDGRLIGYQLLIEQPNKSFLVRNGRSDTGNLYKLIWYGQGIIGQHEKKTHLSTGHDDLLQLISGLNGKRGAAQWEFIQQNFNVEEAVNYYAVNMCISNWDGFFNNYFTYHDQNGTGKWEIYPWDEDKTWGDYDGASARYDWYEMPLTFGMNGDRPPGGVRSFFGGGPFGGTSWWRPPGHFSGPLLSNPEFRKRFLARLREICTTVFTEETMGPVIRDMETRLTPEIPVRARAIGQDPQQDLRRFQAEMRSFLAQVQNRRKFILAELDKENP